MDKIHNVFIKHHQRGRWRYLSLLAQSVTHASQRVPNSNKKHFKNQPHFI